MAGRRTYCDEMPKVAPPIVVGFDASAGARAALRWALDEAAQTGTAVYVLYAFDWPLMPGPVGLAPAVWPDYGAQQEAEEIVAAAVTAASESHPDVQVTGNVVPGSATAVLVDRSHRARLLVLGGRGAGGFAGQLLGSTSISVCAHARCPVVVVRGREPAGAPIVAGVDGSEESLLAVEFAFGLAAGRGTSLRVVRAWDPPAAEPEVRTEADLAATIEELIGGWRDKYPQVSTTVQVVARPPTEALIEASADAQLVAVGSRGRGGFRGLLLGSVSQKLLYHAACPVAVIRALPT